MTKSQIRHITATIAGEFRNALAWTQQNPHLTDEEIETELRRLGTNVFVVEQAAARRWVEALKGGAR